MLIYYVLFIVGDVRLGALLSVAAAGSCKVLAGECLMYTIEEWIEQFLRSRGRLSFPPQSKDLFDGMLAPLLNPFEQDLQSAMCDFQCEGVSYTRCRRWWRDTCSHDLHPWVLLHAENLCALLFGRPQSADKHFEIDATFSTYVRHVGAWKVRVMKPSTKRPKMLWFLHSG